MSDKYHLVTTITTREAAHKYWDGLVKERMAIGGYTKSQAEKIERSNVSYWLLDCDEPTQKRVADLFGIDPVQSL